MDAEINLEAALEATLSAATSKTSDDTDSEETLAELSDAEREARKPDISRLPPAISPEGMPAFRIGERIVIERRASILNHKPYLDTRTYMVMGINTETGALSLYDESLRQMAQSNYITGANRGYVFKLAGRHAISTKRKRGRPRKNPIEMETPVDPNAPPPEKKKRGRPKGSKNRDQDTIKAEKKAKLAARMERKAKRKARRK